MRRFVFVGLAVACALATLSQTTPLSSAAEGRTPIFAPTTISADGKYIVTRNIGPAPTALITVLSTNVDIDLNGFVLDNGPTPQPVISISLAGGVEQITIRNGSLKGGSAGIDASVPATKAVIEDVKIQGPSGIGIHLLDVSSLAIRRNLVTSSGGVGIVVDGAGTAHSGTIEGNVVRDAAGGILVFNGSSVAVLHNRIDGGTGNGIDLVGGDGCLLSENTIERVNGMGINLVNSIGNKLYDNVVREARSHAIHLDPASNDNLVVMNSATNNGFGLPGGHGLFVEGKQNFIDRNILNSNSGFGLRLAAGSASNTFGRNMARGNAGGGGGPCAAAPGLFPPNSCNDGAVNTTFGDNLIPGPPVF
jgi:parallel beta-helix repeat protein